MDKEAFDYQDYKLYLNDRLDDPILGGRGSRARLSEAIQCQTAYTAQVLRGTAHFSLEQAEAINEFLGHTEEQGSFFLVLIQFARAGSPRLKERFRKQLEKTRESRLVLKNRLNIKQTLSQEKQMIYYSSWIYGGVHAAISVPELQTVEAVARHFQLQLEKAAEVLQFLVATGLAVHKSGRYQVGTSRIHLGSDSPLISKHHTNWRIQAIRSLDASSTGNLHYSSVISLSEEDSLVIQELLAKTIEKAKPIIRDSPAEQIHCLSMDFFRI
jgi:uncharacterized protein (TIGR02147 family)